MTENVATDESITMPPTRLQDFWRRNSALLKLTGLIGILLFAFWVGMDPHWESKYPMHVDEYTVIGYTDAMLEEGSLSAESPYRRDGRTVGRDEVGFLITLGAVKEVSGLSWLGLYRVAPAAILVLLSFLVYVFGKRAGFGWAAALFIPLVPTSTRTLGPAFLVAFIMGLLLIVVALIILSRMGNRVTLRWCVLLSIVIMACMLIHPIAGGILVMLVFLGLAVRMVENMLQKSYREAFKVYVASIAISIIPVLHLGLWVTSRSKQVLLDPIVNSFGIAYPNLVKHLGISETMADGICVITGGLLIVGAIALLLGVLIILLIYIRSVRYGKRRLTILASLSCIFASMWAMAYTGVFEKFGSINWGDTSQYELLGPISGFPEAFGAMAVVFFIIGYFFYLANRPNGRSTYVLALLIVLLAAHLFVIYPAYKEGPQMLYNRGWLCLGLFMAIFAGYGVYCLFLFVPRLAKRAEMVVSPRFAMILRPAVYLGVVALLITALISGLANNERDSYARYYHMVGDRIYSDFVWLDEHTTSGNNQVLMEPSLAWSYPALGGPEARVPYAQSYPYPMVPQIIDIVVRGQVDVEWLKKSNIFICYTRLAGSQRETEIVNSHLARIRPAVYILTER